MSGFDIAWETAQTSLNQTVLGRIAEKVACGVAKTETFLLKWFCREEIYLSGSTKKKQRFGAYHAGASNVH